MKMTPKEVAKALGVTVGTLANMRYQGRGPKFKYEKMRVVYLFKDVKEWKDKRG